MPFRHFNHRAVAGILLAFSFSITAFTTIPAQAQQAAPDILPLLEKTPRIDGRIETGEWQKAHSLGAFQTRNSKEEFPETEAWIGRDSANIYMAVRTAEPFPDKIKTTVIPDEKDGDVALDDCIHLFIDMGNTGKSIFQLISNSAGTIYDAGIVNGMISPAAWESGATVRTRINATGWEVEMAVPLQSMGHELVRGEIVSVNVARVRYVTGQRQTASLTKGSLAAAKDFIPFLIDSPLKAGRATVVSTQRGPFFRGRPGMWEFQVTQSGAQNGALEMKFPGLKTASRTFALKPGTQNIAYEIPADQVQSLSRIVLNYNGQTIYSSAYRVEELPTPDRVAVTQNPLFDELIVPNPAGLSKEGVIMWAHDIKGPPHPSLIARRTGTVYNPNLVLQELARDRSIIITGRGGLKAAAESKLNIKTIIRLDPRSALKSGALQAGKIKWPWMQDPHTIAAFLEDARKSIELAKVRTDIWGLFMGDETWEINDSILKWFLDNRRSDYPALVKADAEIKEKYGFGKYGLPESSTDPNPFRWIATRRWEADQMMDLAQQVKAMIDKDAPRLKLVSWDNRDGHQPFELHRWGAIFDVITGQLYPARDKYRQNTAFNTKFLSDLTQTKEFWPVPHVEHYPANFTPEETNELLSQAFRNGATGLHLYSSDTIGRRAGKGSFATDRIGAPERWQVIQSVIDRLEKPFTVRQPKADTAIFYSNTSYQSQVNDRHSQEPEWIYTILGPRLKSALAFIDDFQARENPQQLAQYKTIYVPYARVVDDKEYNALQSYVEQGGTLVINDPLAFRYRSDGSERTNGAILPPIVTQKAGAAGAIQTVQGKELTSTGARYALKKEAGKTLVRDDQNVPVVQEVALGKGKVLFFGMNPLVPSVIKDAAWIEFYRHIQQNAGAKLDNDIWRFRFPLPAPNPAQHPAGVCLTNNYFEWHLSEALPVANAAMPGSYRLSIAAAEPADQEISFKEGKLTDRREGVAAANDALPQNYELSWKTDEPLTITFKFDEKVTADQARLFFSGTLPDGWCEVSEDGEEWQKVDAWKLQATDTVNNVALQAVSWQPHPASHLRFHFNAVPGKKLSLAEVDIWGSPS